MKTTSAIYPNFKPYEYYQNIPKGENKPHQNKIPNIKPLIGSSLGVVGALALSSKLPKKQTTANEVMHMLLMAGGANVGGVLAGSIGKTQEQKKKKWKEAGFQVMNISIPMIMVSSILEICKNVKALNNNTAKIIGSVTGMVGGAITATKITNLSKKENEPERKYTIKDSIANFDDIVATIKIGFKEVAEVIPVDKILPFIYIYSGARAGDKE